MLERAPETALDAARYVCRRVPSIPKTSWVKLLYLADREYARRYGKSLTGAGWWRERWGPLSGALTSVLERPEFKTVVSLTQNGNRRVGITETEAGELKCLGAAQLAVLDLIVSKFGDWPQVRLLDYIHELPEVKSAPMKGRIAFDFRPARAGSPEYVEELLRELDEERAAGLYAEVPEVPESERAARRQDAEALLGLIQA